MISFSELSKKRFRSVQKCIRFSQVTVVVVMRVDKEKKYVDVSRKRVSQLELQIAFDRWSKTDRLITIASRVASLYDLTMYDINSQIFWPMARSLKDKNFYEYIISNIEHIET